MSRFINTPMVTPPAHPTKSTKSKPPGAPKKKLAFNDDGEKTAVDKKEFFAMKRIEQANSAVNIADMPDVQAIDPVDFAALISTPGMKFASLYFSNQSLVIINVPLEADILASGYTQYDNFSLVAKYAPAFNDALVNLIEAIDPSGDWDLSMSTRKTLHSGNVALKLRIDDPVDSYVSPEICAALGDLKTINSLAHYLMGKPAFTATVKFGAYYDPDRSSFGLSLSVLRLS